MAVVNFEKSILVDHDNISARMNIATIYLDYLDYTGAKAQFEHVLNIEPDNIQAHIGRGSCLYGLMQYKEAIKEYRTAIKLDKRKNILLLRIAELYENKLSDLDTAVAVLKEYVTINNLPPSHEVSKKIGLLKQLKVDMEKMKKQEEIDKKKMEEQEKLDKEKAKKDAEKKDAEKKDGDQPKEDPVKDSEKKEEPKVDAPVKDAPKADAPEADDNKKDAPAADTKKAPEAGK